MQAIKVKILDSEYLIKSDGDAAQVHRIAEYLDEKMREVMVSTEGLSEKKMAILTALNIAGDYFQLLKEHDELLAQHRQRTEALIYSIDSAIK